MFKLIKEVSDQFKKSLKDELLGDANKKHKESKKKTYRQVSKEFAKSFSRNKGVRFYDKKGSGYIKGGKKKYDQFAIQNTYRCIIMVNFLMPIAISIINKAVDRIPDDLDSVIKDFLIKLLRKAAAKTGNKVDDQLVEALQKALLEG